MFEQKNFLSSPVLAGTSLVVPEVVNAFTLLHQPAPPNDAHHKIEVAFDEVDDSEFVN